VQIRGMLPALRYVPYPGLIRRGGLGALGVDFDLGGIIDSGIQAGESYVTNKVDDYFASLAQSTGSTTDIVPMQNKVGEQIGLLITAYNSAKTARRLTVASITAYQTALRALLTNFCNYARTLGTSRAQAGCDTLMGYFWPGLAIMDKDRLAVGGAYVGQTLYTDPVTGQTYTIDGGGGVGGTATQYLPWIIGGVFLLMSWKNIRKAL
jgi:hypothetical protein